MDQNRQGVESLAMVGCHDGVRVGGSKLNGIKCGVNGFGKLPGWQGTPQQRGVLTDGL